MYSTVRYKFWQGIARHRELEGGEKLITSREEAPAWLFLPLLAPSLFRHTGSEILSAMFITLQRVTRSLFLIYLLILYSILLRQTQKSGVDVIINQENSLV
jgi:hypothetical protein